MKSVARPVCFHATSDTPGDTGSGVANIGDLRPSVPLCMMGEMRIACRADPVANLDYEDVAIKGAGPTPSGILEVGMIADN